MKSLLIVDMQNDFMPGGALAVPGADALIPVINGLIPHFSLVVATQDWHPQEHVSFVTNHPGKKVGELVDAKGIPQILWPIHCVRHTRGAEIVSGLQEERIECSFYKGTDPWIDSYSAFFDNARRKATGLADYLKSRDVDEVYIAGVATDYCVLYSVIDAIDLGFTVFVITDACRGINLDPEDVERALAAMQAKGAVLLTSSAIVDIEI